jgi:hypothetical protein
MVNRRSFLATGTAAAFAMRAAATGLAARIPKQVSVAVSNSVDGAIAGPTYVGFSYEKEVVGLGTFDAANSDLVGLFRLIGASHLRIGGYTVDTNVWDPNGPGGRLGYTAPADQTKLAGFLAATGWSATYGLNYRSSDPATAAAEAASAAAILGPSLVAFEIGNEPNLYTTEPAFEAGWTAFRQAIVTSVPTAAFAAPDTATATSFFSTFAKDESGLFETLTAHHYIASANSPQANVDTLLHSTEREFLAQCRNVMEKVNEPARVSETNNFSSGGKDGVSNTFASALWAVRYLLDGAKYGIAGLNFHGGTSTEFGHELYYSPIRFEGTTGKNVIGVQPEYYGLLLAALVGVGPSYATTVSPPQAPVSAYAIGRNVVLVNIGVADVAATVTMPAAIHSARSLTLRTRGGAGATHGQTLGGAAVGLDGNFQPSYQTLNVRGATFTLPLPAISAALIETA